MSELFFKNFALAMQLPSYVTKPSGYDRMQTMDQTPPKLEPFDKRLT
jgi:hypothetical protein